MIMLIGEDGKKIGEMTMQDAEKIARESDMDLIMVGKNTYKIADEGKLKYERSKKQKLQRAQHRTHKIKEIVLSPFTETHDLNIKSDHIEEFLKKGLKIKITMKFKGRQVAFKDAGLKKILDLIAPFVQKGLAVVDKQPVLEGKNLITLLTSTKINH